MQGNRAGGVQGVQDCKGGVAGGCGGPGMSGGGPGGSRGGPGGSRSFGRKNTKKPKKRSGTVWLAYYAATSMPAVAHPPRAFQGVRRGKAGG